MTDQSSIWEKIVQYNTAYRCGDPQISDDAFDDILDSFIATSQLDEVEVRSKLMSAPGKVKHDQMCGSLKKTKAEDDSFDKWWSKQSDDKLIVSAKVDGMSLVAKFVDGQFVSAATRGDGELGENQTAKCKHIIPNIEDSDFTGTIRGELTLTNSSFEQLQIMDQSREHKNLRNSTVGIIGNKKTIPELCNLVSFIAYEIVNSDLTRHEQLRQLENWNFEPPLYFALPKETTKEDLTRWYEKVCEQSNYMVDGLVVHGDTWIGENDKYYPDNARAFKVNNSFAKSHVTEVDWNLGKTGKLTPIVNIDPVQLIGTTVSRATAHNASYVFKEGIVSGSIVTIQKSGDIIPCIIKVEGTGTLAVDEIACPGCEHEVTWDKNRTHLICVNEDCEGKSVKQVESFIIKMGIEGITSKSLIRFDITSYEDLFKFKADPKYKKQVQLEEDILTKVFTAPTEQILKCLTWKGSGRKTLDKLFDRFGYEQFNKFIELDDCMVLYDVSGIGKITIDNIRASWLDNCIIMEMITLDERYNEKKKVVIETVQSSDTLNGQTFCITGKTDQPRKQLQQMVVDNGGTIASVSGKLKYLVCGASGVGPSKIQKAQKLNISVITEHDFISMIS
jgi:DNA ligase (NAD+)